MCVQDWGDSITASMGEQTRFTTKYLVPQWLPPLVSWVILAAGILCCARWIFAFTGDAAPVVIVMSRSLSSVLPRWDYDTDQLRFVGTVTEPLCDRPPSPEPSRQQPRSVAHCEILDGKVKVVPRPRLKLGVDGSEVDAHRFRAWLVDSERRIDDGWPVGSATVHGTELELEPVPGMDAGLMLQVLRTTPLVFDSNGWPAGTGRYVVEDVWIRRTSVSPVPVGVPDSIHDYLSDVIVLRERTGRGVRAQRLVLVGLGSYEAPVAQALSRELDTEGLHLVLHVEGEFAKGIAIGRQAVAPWTLDQRPADRVMLAAISFNEPDPCRSELLRALRCASRNPGLIQSVGFGPAVQPFPPSFPMARFQDVATGCDAAVGSDSRCGVVVLTNTTWEDFADRLATAMTNRVDPLVIAVRPDVEDVMRRSHAYDVSLLALMDDFEPPAYFLYSNLKSTAWVDANTVTLARNLASSEAQGRLDAVKWERFLDDLDESIVALASPVSFNAVNHRLQGTDPSIRFLDPQLRLAAVGPGTGWIVLGLLLTVAGIGGVSYQSLRRRARAGRQRLQAQVDYFTHEITAPLATIKAYAEGLVPFQPDEARAIEAQANEALEHLDRTQLLFGTNGIVSLQERESSNLGDAIRPALSWAAGRADGMDVTWEQSVDVPTDLPPITVPAEVLGYVARILLDNALKYRKGERAKVRIEFERDRATVIARFQDWGEGISLSFADHDLFRRGVRSAEALRSNLPGFGFGLALCREILSRFGARIDLTSRSEPTEFQVRLPTVSARKGGLR